MSRLDIIEIRGSIRNGGRRTRGLMLALALTLVWGGIGDVRAEHDAEDQDPTARVQLKLVPRAVGGNANTPHPPRRIVVRMVERRPVGILERLASSGPAESANRAFAGVVDAVRDGVDMAWIWWLGESEVEQVFDEPREVGAPSPSRSRLPLPISSSPAQQRLLEVEDPYEAINRLVFGMNSGLRAYVLNPFTDLYHERTTREIRKNIRHFFNNLREPVTIASSAMAGNLTDAGNATARFGINTTLGIAGLFDPATGMGFDRRPHDFEEMLCQYGVPPGPYVVLPLLGPATARDAVVRLLTVAAYLQVMGASIYVPYRVSDITARYVDIRETVESLDADALDPYVVHRTLYITRRNESCGKPSVLEQYFTR